MPQNKAPISTNTVRSKKSIIEDVAEPVNKVISFIDLSSILN